MAMPFAQCYGRSPKAGDGELQKAAPEASFIGPSGHQCPRHVNDCKTSWRSCPRSPVCVYKRLYVYVGPHLLLANTQRGSPPPRATGEMRLPETAAGPVLRTVLHVGTMPMHRGVGVKPSSGWAALSHQACGAQLSISTYLWAKRIYSSSFCK